MSLAAAILEQLEELARGYPGRRITRVRLAWGELEQINEYALCEALKLITQDGPMKGVELDLQVEPARGRCTGCGEAYDLVDGEQGCPACGGRQVELVPDKPLTLEQIELTGETERETT
jgi:hydrogenase nickel incorporation protein HypA/HybF